MEKERERGGKHILTLTDSNFQLDLLLKDASGGDTTSFVKNGEWDLIGLLPTMTM